MSSIHFFSEEVPFRLQQIRKTRAWLQTCILNEEKIAGEISYIFCNDEYLLNMNMEYLKHDTLTDIITFDYCEDDHISGDIFISIPRVKENAKIYHRHFRDELKRVMVHGVLHLCGYKDKSVKDSTQMRQKEDACLSLFEQL